MDNRAQLEAHVAKYGESARERWDFHYTTDPFTRYIRDRRLHVATSLLSRHLSSRPDAESILVACGGVGGEGTFLANHGWADVTVSDFTPSALELCRSFDPRLKVLTLDAQDMALDDNSFDFVLVQDGLHHLAQPARGLTEMLRVARRGAVVIEPHYGLAGRILGREWEVEGDAVNYVFRWNSQMVEQVAKSYLLQYDLKVHVARFWDHGLAIGRATQWVPTRQRARAARLLYAGLAPARRAGNMMVAVVEKGQEPAKKRLLGH